MMPPKADWPLVLLAILQCSLQIYACVAQAAIYFVEYPTYIYMQGMQASLAELEAMMARQ